MKRGLTKEQLEQFKILYLKGVPSTRIWDEMGIEVLHHVKGSKMQYYREKLGLPKRGRGWNYKTEQFLKNKKARQRQAKKERIVRFRERIKYYHVLIKKLEAALSRAEENINGDS